MSGQFIVSQGAVISAASASGYITVPNVNLFPLNSVATLSAAGQTSQLVKIVEVVLATNQLGVRFHPAAGATNTGQSAISVFNGGRIDMPAQFVEDGDILGFTDFFTFDGTTLTATVPLAGATDIPVTLTAFGSTPNANGASIALQVLTLQPASLTLPGGVNTATQVFGGSKEFANGLKTNLINAYSASSLSLLGAPTDASNAIGTIVGSSGTLADAGALLLTVKNNTSTVFTVGTAGKLSLGSAANITITSVAGANNSSYVQNDGTYSYFFGGAGSNGLLLGESGNHAAHLRNIRPTATNLSTTFGGGRNLSTTATNHIQNSTSGYVPFNIWAPTVSPASGTGTFTTQEIRPTVNGTSSGVFTALAIAPIITAFTGGTTYLIDAGTTSTDYSSGFTRAFAVSTAGVVTATGYVSPNTASTTLFTSDITAVTASSSVGAFTFKPTAVLDAGDLVLDIQNSIGSSIFSVTRAGKILCAGSSGGPSITCTSGDIGTGTGGDFLHGRFSIFSAADGRITFSSTTAGAGLFTTAVTAANAGATAATAGFKFYPTEALTSTDWVFNIGNQNNAASLFSVNYSGSTVQAGSLTLSSYTDDSATPGNRTVDKVRGKNAVAIGATQAVITNSFCTANSQVLVTLESTDATALYLRSVIPSGTGFTVTLGPATATAAVVFSWVVIN